VAFEEAKHGRSSSLACLFNHAVLRRLWVAADLGGSSIMTIIIRVGGTLFADQGRVIDGHAAQARKVHQRDGFLWGSAGQTPTHEMVNADSVESLLFAFRMHPKQYEHTSLLLVTADGCWQCYFEADEFVREVVDTDGFAIGKYRHEWYNYRSKLSCPLEDSAALFCSLVTELWGLGKTFSIAELAPGA